VDVTVTVGGDSRAERFLGTFDEISRLSLDIDRNYGNKRVLTDFPLVNDGSKWTGTINKLIVGFDYTITGHAYKNDNVSDNTSFLEIFRGDTQHTVTEGTNSLNLRLSPLLDDRELTVPRITRINRPFQMLASTSDNITVAVDTVKKDGSSAIDATLSFRFRSVDNESMPLDNTTGGSFSPGEGDVTKSGSSYPDISTTYTAPDNDSNMKLQVRVSNELEIGVTSHFNVYVTDDIETQNTVDTNPVIENISAERLDNGDLKWTMNVSNDDGFSGLKVKWEYLFGDNRTFTSQSNTVTQGDNNRGVMEAIMSGYQDSDDGMLLVTVCEDGGSAGIPSECAYMNEASTSVSMELIPGAYEQPIICDGNSCSHDYEGTWIACDTNNKNPGGDHSFATSRITMSIGSGKLNRTVEYLENDNGNCSGDVGLTLKMEASVTDNGSKKYVALDSDNVSASMFELNMSSVKLSFNDLSYVNGLKPDNETYLCGESYWTGVEHEVAGCNFKNDTLPAQAAVMKGIAYVTDNDSLKIKVKDQSDYPDSFGCSILALESTGNYLYPTCKSLGLIGHYTFDGNAEDSSGNDFHGTVHGATLTSDRDGNANKAYAFDGNDDYILVADNDALDGFSNGFSISVWLKTNSEDNQEVISKTVAHSDKTIDDSYRLAFQEPNRDVFSNAIVGAIQVQLTDQHSTDLDLDSHNFISSSIIINDGKWHHVVFVWDGNGFKFSVDGINDTNLTYYDNKSTSSDINNSTNVPLVIGALDDNNTGNYFNNFIGHLDDLRIYNRGLSDSEISDLYGGGAQDNSSLPGITVNVISDNTTEAGGTASFTVKLDSEPSANVTIPISSDNVSEGTVSISSLTFTSSNWNSAQTVTVTGVDDSVVDDNVTYNIVIGSSTSSDSNYDGVDVRDVTLNNLPERHLVPSDFSTIQFAIDASSIGDEVFVSIGTYDENINFNGRSISVIGANRETTIIDGNQSGSVVTFSSGEDATAKLSGFTLQNGSGSDTSGGCAWGGELCGGGIIVTNGSNPNLENLVVTNNGALNTSLNGGGIFIYESSNPRIKNVKVIENNSKWGGGIYIGNSAPEITNSTISGNKALNNGGGFILKGSNPTLKTLVISNNVAETSHGGGIDCYYYYGSDHYELSNLVINGNTSGSPDLGGGGVYFYECKNFELKNSVIYGNEAASGGGALFNGLNSDGNYSPKLTNSIVWNNSNLNGALSQIKIVQPINFTTSFSDVEGGLNGSGVSGTVINGGGNIDADPMFVEANNGDFNLQTGSPAINAGDPNSTSDPDGSIADMGAFFRASN